MESKSSRTPLVAIVGETASGKTAAALKVAKQIGGEIICADSRTVYKYMDIGTAKPTKLEQKNIPHHLIDVVEPTELFNVAEFKQLTEQAIQEVNRRGKIPILVGGTGLYIDAVLYNFQFGDETNPEMHNKLEKMNDVELTTYASENNIHIQVSEFKNRRHLIRKLERGGDKPKQTNLREGTLVVGLSLEREVLKNRITKRVERMFVDGFVQEVSKLRQKYDLNAETFKTPGYKSVSDYLDGKVSLEEAKEQFTKADFQLAKRQRTWFKRNEHIEWFDNLDLLVKRAVEFATRFH